MMMQQMAGPLEALQMARQKVLRRALALRTALKSQKKTMLLWVLRLFALMMLTARALIQRVLLQPIKERRFICSPNGLQSIFLQLVMTANTTLPSFQFLRKASLKKLLSSLIFLRLIKAICKICNCLCG